MTSASQRPTRRIPLEIGEGAAGWYLVEGTLGEGVAAPHLRLHVERTDAEAETVPLAVTGQRLASPVVFAGTVTGAWLERDDAGPMPGIESPTLRRIGRPAAMRRMLLGLRRVDGHRDPLHVVRALLDTIATARRDGIGHAGTLLRARYLHGLRPARTVGAPARLHLGWPSLDAHHAELRAVNHLQPLTQARGDWEATGDDPSFRLEDHGVPVFLKAGWYRLRMRIERLEDSSALAPTLYPDHGHGYQPADMIRLPEADSRGRIDALLLFKQDVHALRFDPSLRHSRFSLGSFALRRLGRPAALLRMLAIAGRDSGRGAAGTALAFAHFARAASRDGLSVAASDLFEQQAGNRGGSYPDWVRRYDTLHKPELEHLRQRADRIADAPLISLVLPVYATPETWLRRCIDSVLRQAYPHWELCIADDASPGLETGDILREYAARDPRIKLAMRTANGHISAASNSALELASGQFVGLLDHDDELRPHALLEMAEAICADRELALLYSDEDKIDAEGRRFQPYFKPDWNPDLLLSQNYVCHFTVIQTDLVRAVGGFRVGFEGSQDHDLILRCAERLAPQRIRHVPKILYHWRAIPGSTAMQRDSKDYAAVAGLRAVSEHLQRQHCAASVEELPHGHYRVRWAIPEPAPKVSIIIPTRDRAGLLRTCVESVLARTDYPDFEIIVVDNQSVEAETLAYFDELRDNDRVSVLHHDAPFNYSAINNRAAAQCDGTLLCLLNNDIEAISAGWLTEMAGHALRPDIGAVGAMLYYPDRSIQHAGVILGIQGVANHAYIGRPAGHPGHGARALVAQELSAVTGACLVVRRELYERVGGLDEALSVAFNDVDFCLRLRRAGYRNVWTPFAELVHHESATRGSDDTPEKNRRFAGEVALMQQRWGDELQRDPAYNPNLTLQETDFGLAFPPRPAHA